LDTFIISYQKKERQFGRFNVLKITLFPTSPLMVWAFIAIFLTISWQINSLAGKISINFPRKN
jgi:hypothetical protein